MRRILFALLAATAPAAHAATLEQATIKAGDVEVPIAIALPPGKGPFPPVLFIHAKRGIDENEQKHIMELADQGFLVVMPDWQAGRMIERWPSEHDPATEGDVEAALDYLLKHPGACRMAAGIVGQSRGPYSAIRLAAIKALGQVATAVLKKYFNS